MTVPGRYNPPAAYEGNTSDPLAFDFEFDLSDYVIKFDMNLNGAPVRSLSVGDGITVDGTQATVGPFDVPQGDGRGATSYDYELILTSSEGVRTVYVRGKYKVLGDIKWRT